MSILIFVVFGWAIGMIIMVFTLPKFVTWLCWRDFNKRCPEITWQEFWEKTKAGISTGGG